MSQEAQDGPLRAGPRRIGSVIGIAPEHLEAYRQHHRDVWPEVLAALRDANVTNYSIYEHGDLLFSYLEYRGSDYEADMARLSEDPATKHWWALVMPMQYTLRSSDDSAWWKELPELFHMD